MIELVKALESEKATVANQAAVKPAENRPQTRVISDPLQVTAIVLAQMNVVNAKKDELTIAIKGLTDITQQLTHAYAGQMQVIEQLANRVKALEAKALEAKAPEATAPEEKAGASWVSRLAAAQSKVHRSGR